MHPEKEKQLGMNPSTAAHRLRVDLLFKFAVQLGHVCYHCGGVLDRDSFSIEHKEPWLHTDDPKASFFDLENIGFSHLGCNSRFKRHPSAIPDAEEREQQRLAAKRANAKKHYTAERRASRYARANM